MTWDLGRLGPLDPLDPLPFTTPSSRVRGSWENQRCVGEIRALGLQGRCLLPPGSQVLPGFVCGFWEVSSGLCALEVSHLPATGLAFLQVPKSAASLTKRKMTAMAHTKTVVQGARMVHKTKAPVPPQDMGHKAQPTSRVRKTKSPEDPKRPGLPPKISSKAPSKKAEPGN